MNIRIVPRSWLVLLVLLPALLACNFLSQAIESTQPPPTPLTSTEALPTQDTSISAPQPLLTTPNVGTTEPIRQWAVDAVASSEWGDPDWTARQATGEPNTFECDDLASAWAASGKDTVEWINLYYQIPVYVTEINVIQTYNPDQVVQVDLIDMQGSYVTLYTSQPKRIDSPCPYTLSIPVSRSDILAQGVRITIDQSTLGIEWNEIDAVEIVGMPGEGSPVRPLIPAP